MSVLQDVYRGDNNFNFIRAWRVGLIVAVIVCVGSVTLLFTRGLNLGIDFEGGGVWEVPVSDVSVEQARDVTDGLGIGEAKIQFATNADGTQILRVQAGVDAVDRTGEVTSALADLAGVTNSEVSVSTVGPSWGDAITKQAVRALVFFFFAITLYMSIRLEWRMAVGALAAVVNDLLLSVGVYSLFRFEVTPATVIAFLTVLGFSLYDTIVVFDKAQDNTARVVGRQPYREIMNRSLNQTLMRSINTTIATILPIMSLLLIGAGFLGAATLKDFGIALFVGLSSGAYSSIMVAAPVVVMLKEREPRFAPAGDAVPVAAAPVRSSRGRPAKAAAGGAPKPTTSATPAASATGPIPARPRKTKKRR
jgi:preprotein translocase subunit SecF